MKLLEGQGRLRTLALVTGIVFLLWLPIEDTQIYPVLLFACWMAGLGTAHLLRSSPPGPGRRWLVYPLAGCAGGLIVTPLAIFLMAFKSGLHGHGAPDFTPAQIVTVVYRTPIWVLTGLFLGAGAALWRQARSA